MGRISNFSEEALERYIFILMTRLERDIYRIAVDIYGEENCDASFFYKNQRECYIKILRSFSDDTLRNNAIINSSTIRHTNIYGYTLLKKLILEGRIEDAKVIALDYASAVTNLARENGNYRYTPEQIAGATRTGNNNNYCSYDTIRGYAESKIFIKRAKEKVTLNEDEAISTTIYDCYWSIGSFAGMLACRECLQRNQIGLALLRTSYTKEQFAASYVHSHVPKLNNGSKLTGFSFCVGSGNINDYVKRIRNHVINYNEIDEFIVRGFFAMLNVVLRVESSAGGPYNHITNISSNDGIRDVSYIKSLERSMSVLNTYSEISAKIDRAKAKSMLRDIHRLNLFKFSICDGKIKINNPFIDVLIRMSELNKKYFSSPSSFIDCTITEDGKIKEAKSSTLSIDTSSYDGLFITFKGKRDYFKIIQEETFKDNKTIQLLKPQMLDGMINIVMYEIKKYIFQNKKVI